MKTLPVFLLLLVTVFILVIGQRHFTRANQQRTQYSAQALGGNHNAYSGQNWYAIGDSITFANQYQPVVKNALDLSHVVTDAIPGQQVKTMADRVNQDLLRNANLITVFGGTNDYGRGKPLGSMSDPATKDTFYGNLKAVIEKLEQSKPQEARIVFFTPLKRAAYKNQPVYPHVNAAGYKLEDYVQAIKDVCAASSIPVIDLFAKSGLNPRNIAMYTRDGLHPNKAGYVKISRVMSDQLNRLTDAGEKTHS